mgnify:CR=1 FL=1
MVLRSIPACASQAALSSRLEFYPVNLPPQRAVKLATNSLPGEDIEFEIDPPSPLISIGVDLYLTPGMRLMGLRLAHPRPGARQGEGGGVT